MRKALTEPFQYPRQPLPAFIPKEDKGAPSADTGSKKLRPKKSWATIRRLAGYLMRHRGGIILVLFMVVMSSSLALLGPFMIGRAIDRYMAAQSGAGLSLLLIGLTVVYLIYSLTLWLQNYRMISIAQNIIYTLRTELFGQLVRLPIPYFDRRQHGELMSRVTNDIENVSSTLNSSVIQIFSSVLTLTGTVALMLWISPLLTLLTFIIIPGLFLGMRWITRRTGPLFKEQQRNLGDLNGFIEETITGHRIVAAFSREEKVIAEFNVKNGRYKSSGFWAQAISGFIPKLLNALNNASFAIIAGIGGVFAYYDQISIGDILIFAEYSRQFSRPLNDLSNQFNTLLSAIAGAERVFEVMDEQTESNDEADAQTIENLQGEVVFDHVSFGYQTGGNTLTDISFRVSPGETVALVGPTGAGKTTLINLLARFYETDQGTIWIDGHDMKQIHRESLRSRMAVVLQDSIMFHGTVSDNIRFGRLDATESEVVEAAKLANAHAFIMKLPKQYNTVIDMDGSGISQGQKQLLSIARAVLAKPSILILDEATSNIDTVTEINIQEALHRLMQGRTSFVIAHRLNTIRGADQILVLREGRIVERGSHEQLLEQQGFYSDLHLHFSGVVE